MNEKIIAKTQNTLGRIIQKPALTEKLLTKPPFRFLHDIIKVVIKTTGFMNGLYTSDELNSENVKDRDSKITFLQKAIDIVALATGQKLSVRPQKVVTGHEAEKTNEFLQALSMAIDSKPNNSRLVRKVLEKRGKDDDEITKEGKESEESHKDKKSAKAADRHSDRDREKHKDKSGERDREMEPSREHRRRSSHRREREHGAGDREYSQEKHNRKADEELESERGDDHHGRSKQDQPHGSSETEDKSKLQRPNSAKGLRRRKLEVNEPTDGQDIGKPLQETWRLARPPSARPAAPKVNEEREPEVLGANKTNVIIENERDSDEDDGFAVQEARETSPDLEITKSHDQEDLGEEDHGGLVKKILESKKEFQSDNQERKNATKENEKPMLSHKDRDNIRKDIEKLRGNIQAVTKSALPLGKVLDFIQEDLDAMQKEREKWREESKQQAAALKREESVTHSEIEPLNALLKDLDEQIADMMDRIVVAKGNVFHNDNRIQKMLSAITTQT